MTATKKLSETPLGKLILDLIAGAESEGAPILLTQWEREFVESLKLKMNSDEKWLPGIRQTAKINEIWVREYGE